MHGIAQVMEQPSARRPCQTVSQAPIMPNPEEMKFYQPFLALTEPLLQNRCIKSLPMVVNKNGSGLEGVLKGLEEMESGNVSGEKLVYTI